MEQIKQNLTETKKTTQDKNKKCGTVLSETSPSEHDAKNSDMNQDNDDIEGQNKGSNYGIKFKKLIIYCQSIYGLFQATNLS